MYIGIVGDENITQGDLIIVKWYDTEDNSEWEKIILIDLMKPPLAKHVGWFISEDEDCIRGAYSICDEHAGRWVIPKRSIISIEKVRDDELDAEA